MKIFFKKEFQEKDGGGGFFGDPHRFSVKALQGNAGKEKDASRFPPDSDAEPPDRLKFLLQDDPVSHSDGAGINFAVRGPDPQLPRGAIQKGVVFRLLQPRIEAVSSPSITQ